MTPPLAPPPEPLWLIAANVVRWRRYGDGGQELRPGTKAYRGGAKVYVIGSRPGGHEQVTTVGPGRHTGAYIALDMATRHLHSFRAALVRSPAVLRREAENDAGQVWDGREEAEETAARLEGLAAELRAERWHTLPHPTPCLCHTCLTAAGAAGVTPA
ncbi:hypothetical protein ACIQ9K_20255 [Streptomyces microflavus]|uniref:Uncharacterized protein n=1 Tax=Streptomyces microflavus DSM 40593 TaxID=1303692 RepID=N0CYC4_STRMI|nr:hypothetical protein [Streptomyces microflavus]AGK80775.1 hypothetical protein SFUL_5892 [Streptomyces microflavus DSM 40593]